MKNNVDIPQERRCKGRMRNASSFLGNEVNLFVSLTRGQRSEGTDFKRRPPRLGLTMRPLECEGLGERQSVHGGNIRLVTDLDWKVCLMG